MDAQFFEWLTFIMMVGIMIKIPSKDDIASLLADHREEQEDNRVCDYDD